MQKVTPESIVVEEVARYFSEPIFQKFSIEKECSIQMGSENRRADVVLIDRKSNLAAIAECKRHGDVGHGVDQLKSYLSATDTPFGIFANSTDSELWVFYENLGRNQFREITSAEFEAFIGKNNLIAKALNFFTMRSRRPLLNTPNGKQVAYPLQSQSPFVTERSQSMSNPNGHDPYYCEQNGFYWATNHRGIASCLPPHIQLIIRNGEVNNREVASSNGAESEITQLRSEIGEIEKQKLISEQELSEKRQKREKKGIELTGLKVELEKPTSVELELPVESPANVALAKQGISWTHIITGSIAAIFLIILASYLFFFYASVVDKAFFLHEESIQEQLDSGTYAGVNDIVNPSAIFDAFVDINLIVILFPIVFLSLAIAFHHFLERQDKWKWIAPIIILMITFIFDCLLAVKISQQIHQAKVLMGQERGEWVFRIDDLNIWIVIFCGFVVSLLTSVLYHVTCERLNGVRSLTDEAKQWVNLEKKRRKQLEAKIETEKNLRKKEVAVLEEEMESLQRDIAQLEDKISSLQGEIGNSQAKIDVRLGQGKKVSNLDRNDIESQVNQFLNGWLRYIAHSGAGEAEIEAAKKAVHSELAKYYEEPEAYFSREEDSLAKK